MQEQSVRFPYLRSRGTGQNGKSSVVCLAGLASISSHVVCISEHAFNLSLVLTNRSIMVYYYDVIV